MDGAFGDRYRVHCDFDGSPVDTGDDLQLLALLWNTNQLVVEECLSSLVLV